MTDVFQQVHAQDADPAVALTAYALYLRTVHWIPVMTDAERVGLVERIERGKREQQQVTPDIQVLADARHARDQLIESYQRLVLFLMQGRRYRFRVMDEMDLIQEGNLALMRMIEHYTLTEVENLGALAAGCIRHGLTRLLRDYDAPIRTPGNVVEAIVRMKRMARELEVRLGRYPDCDELAEALQVSGAKVREWMVAEREREVESLQVLMSIDEDDAEHLCSFVSLYTSASEAEQVRQEAVEDAIRQAMSAVLTEHGQQVLTVHYGLEGHAPQTNKEIAQQCGVSEPAIWSAGNRAKKRLRQALEQNAHQQTLDQDGMVA